MVHSNHNVCQHVVHNYLVENGWEDCGELISTQTKQPIPHYKKTSIEKDRINSFPDRMFADKLFWVALNNNIVEFTKITHKPKSGTKEYFSLDYSDPKLFDTIDNFHP